MADTYLCYMLGWFPIRNMNSNHAAGRFFPLFFTLCQVAKVPNEPNLRQNNGSETMCPSDQSMAMLLVLTAVLRCFAETLSYHRKANSMLLIGSKDNCARLVVLQSLGKYLMAAAHPCGVALDR